MNGQHSFSIFSLSVKEGNAETALMEPASIAISKSLVRSLHAAGL